MWFLLVALGLPAGGNAETLSSRFSPDTILVKYQKGLSSLQRQSLLARYGMRREKSFPDLGIDCLHIPSAKGIHAVLASLRHDPAIVYAQPNFRYRLAETLPDDPYFAVYQWNLRNTEQIIAGVKGTLDADIDATELWDLQTGTTDTIVAAIDTGAANYHEDLAANLWTNEDEIPGNGIDDDQNGYIDDWRGWNFYRNDNNSTDTIGHGTHVSGIIGAIGNNGRGVAGVCWHVRIMVLSCFSPTGEATDSDLIEAILYAISNGARVCNASWGDYSYSPAMRDAINYAAAHGVLFVAAAGNTGRQNNDEMPFYPASFDLANVLSVAATDNQDHLAVFSNIGYNTVHVAAPGRNVCSTFAGGGYGFMSGTSMAAPHVVGAAALLLSQNPAFSCAELRSRIIGSSDYRIWLDRATVSNGRLNIARMLEDDAMTPCAISDLSVLANGFDRVILIFTAPGDDAASGIASCYAVRYSTAPITLANWECARKSPDKPKPLAAGTRQLLTVTGLDDATRYYIGIRAVDNVGNIAPVSNIATSLTCPVEQLFFDDFESSPTLWNSGAGWQRSDVDSRSGSFCFTDSPEGDYPDVKGDYILTCPAPIDLSTRHNAYLSFYHQYLFFAPNAPLNDRGYVEASANDGQTWRILKTFYTGSTPWRREIVSLAPLDGASRLLFRFRLHTEKDGGVSDGWYIDDVRVFVPQCGIALTDDIIIETHDRFNLPTPSPDYSDSAPAEDPWFSSQAKSDLPFLRSRNVRFNYTDQITTASAIFVPQILTPGRYEVFVTWGTLANATNVRYTVRHLDGAAQLLLTQHPAESANRWISLGAYSFAYGQDAARGSVTIDESTVSGKPDSSLLGRVYADSIKIVFIEPAPAFRSHQSWLTH